MRDDDELHDYDLSAWEVPDPPSELADAVVARVHDAVAAATDAAVAVAMEPRPGRRSGLFVGVAAVVLAGAIGTGTWAVVRSLRRAEAPAIGAIVADRARHLELGAVAAELDAGADVRWRRTDGHTQIDQRSGTATWRVGDGERLEITAGNSTVEATGASLRVKVHMNMMDARVIGASAVTAAAVAMVTVVVYEGHVRVRDAGQTVVVQPGTTYQVGPSQPPAEPVAVGGGPSEPAHVVATGKRTVAVLGLEVTAASEAIVAMELTDGLRARAKSGVGPDQLVPLSDSVLDLTHCVNDAPECMAGIGHDVGADLLIYGKLEKHAAGHFVSVKLLDVSRKVIDKSVSFAIPAPEASGAALQGWAKRIYAALTAERDATVATGTCDEVSCVLAGYSGACCSRYKHQLPDEIDRAAIAAEMKQLAPAVATCGRQHPATGTVKIHVEVAPDGLPVKVDVLQAPTAELGACVVDKVSAVRFPPTKNGGKFSYPFVFQDSAACDRDALIAKGEQAVTTGKHAEALAAFEAALACGPRSIRIVQLVFMEACNSGNVPKARLYYKQLPADRQQYFVQMCARNGIKQDALESDDTVGYLEVFSTPPATIFVDDDATGLQTPIIGKMLKLATGNHKITYVVRGERFSYPVVIRAGATERMTKDLQ